MENILDLTSKVIPKTESGQYLGQSYSCTFDPNASPEKRWFVLVRYRRVYDVIGGAASLQAAHNLARRKIREINQDVERGIA